MGGLGFLVFSCASGKLGERSSVPVLGTVQNLHSHNFSSSSFHISQPLGIASLRHPDTQQLILWTIKKLLHSFNAYFFQERKA